MQIELKKVRLQSWGGQIWNAKAFEGGEPAYACHVIFPKDHVDYVTKQKTVDMIEAAMKQAASDKFGAKADAILKAAKLSGKVPMREGDTKPESDGYAGNMFVSARGRVDRPPPQVVDRPLNPDGSLKPVKQTDGIIYDGCYVNVTVDIYGYDKGSNGIAAGLRAVRYVGPSDAFQGGAPITAASMAAIPDEDDIEL